MSTQKQPGAFTRQEIESQPAVWAAALQHLEAQAPALADLWSAGEFTRVVFTGCGSTYYLSVAAAAVLQEVTGIPAQALPASEVWLNPAAIPAREGRVLLVAVSRSGETTETLRACESFRRSGRGPILTLSCYPGRALPQLGDLNLLFSEAQEESIAQTRAFTTLYLATVALAALWGGRTELAAELRQLPAVLQRLFDLHAGMLRQLGADLSLDRFYFLGSGVRYGLACELSLKMKEMTLSHSEPFHFMEFRHGPKSMIAPTALVVALISSQRQADDAAVVAEMAAMGGRILAFGEQSAGWNLDIAFASGVSELAQSLLYVPLGQWVALARSLAKGLDPDKPNNLDAVVVLE
jgi:glutamine---fructose-6-phosphate transaminase (isomerizing)